MTEAPIERDDKYIDQSRKVLIINKLNEVDTAYYYFPANAWVVSGRTFNIADFLWQEIDYPSENDMNKL
jgi:hypothetical protein